MPKTNPMLCLTMIVKNESAIIKRCLDSVKQYIDYWVIFDTGSTDNTKEIIKDYLGEAEIPGELHESEFVNFSHNRNEALNASKDKADYLLLMDADLEFRVNKDSFKKTLADLSADSYLVNECDSIHEGNCSGFNYRNKKIVSSNRDWHYVGSTHEVIELKDSEDSTTDHSVNFDEVWFHNRYDGGSKADKFERDVRLLSKEIKDKPEDTRTMFYLAETYLNLFYRNKDNLQYLDNAIYWYEERSKRVDAWSQETYYSLFKLAKAKTERNKQFDFASYLKAYEFLPSRLEPIHEIVKYCRENELYKIGYIIGQSAIDNIKPLEDDALFVDGDVYSHKLVDETSVCASWAGDNESACEMIESIIPIVEGYISEENENRIKENLKICRNLLQSKV